MQKFLDYYLRVASVSLVMVMVTGSINMAVCSSLVMKPLETRRALGHVHLADYLLKDGRVFFDYEMFLKTKDIGLINEFLEVELFEDEVVEFYCQTIEYVGSAMTVLGLIDGKDFAEVTLTVSPSGYFLFIDIPTDKIRYTVKGGSDGIGIVEKIDATKNK